MALLADELRRASAGEARCVLLLADPGVGKTRLAADFAARHRHEIRGLSARAHPLSTMTSFGLWVEALDRELRHRPAEQIERLCGGFLDDLGALLRSVAAVRGSVPDHQPSRARLLEGIAILTGNLSAEAPLVLFLDDVHHADASSCEALAYVLRTVPDGRLLVLLAARTAELESTPNLADLFLALEQEGSLRRVELEPLAHDEVADLARSLLERADVSQPLVDWLMAHSKGNALFAVGLLDALVDEGADLGAPALSRVPQGLEARVRSRLRALDEPSLATLETLALFGEPSQLSDLVRIAGRPLERLGPILEALVASRLVVEEERGAELTYAIAHPLVQESIYRGIVGARRRAMHQLVARALLAGGRLSQAATHYARAATPGDDEAIDVIRSAIAQAEERESQREALMLVDSLVGIIPSGDERWVAVLDAMPWKAEWVIDHRGDAHSSTGTRALQEIRRVLLNRGGDHARLGIVELRLASFTAWGSMDYDTALMYALSAVEHFSRAGEQSCVLMARHEVGYLHGLGGDTEGHAAEARAVLGDAEAIGDRLMIMESLGSLSIAQSSVGDNAGTEASLRRSLVISIEDRKAYRTTWNQAFLATTLAFDGRMAEARELMLLARDSNPDYREALWLELQCFIDFLAGDLAEVVAKALETISWNIVGLSGRRAFAAALAALAELERGEDLAAQRLLRRSAAVYAGRRFLFWHGVPTWVEAVQLSRLGRAADAARLFEEAIDSFGVRPRLYPMAALVYVDAIDAAAGIGDAATAERLLEELSAHQRLVGGRFVGGACRLGAAMVHAAGGDPPRAAEAAREAAALLGDDYALLCGRAMVVETQALEHASGDEARTRAVEALTRAVALFTRSDARVRREAAMQLLRGLGREGRRASAAASALSPREREVAMLAAEGLTSRQIGDRLVIGHRTVETHLASVYAKLGVSSRVELARRVDDLDT